MLKKYQNELLEIIESRQFQKSQFRSSEFRIEADFGFEILFENTPLRFTIKNHHGDYHLFKYKFTQFSPAFEQTAFSSDWQRYPVIETAFAVWLDQHVAEYIQDCASINLWDEIREAGIFPSPSEEYDQQDRLPFSPDEKAKIRISISQFQSVIVKNYNPSQEQLKSIEDRLNYLEKRLDKLNRIDWKSLTFTTIIHIGRILLLDRDKLTELFNSSKEIFEKIIHFLPFPE